MAKLGNSWPSQVTHDQVR